MLAEIAYSNPRTEYEHPILFDLDLFSLKTASRCFTLKETNFYYFAGSAKWYKPIGYVERSCLSSYSFEEVFEEVINSEYVSDSRKNKIIFHLKELANLPVHLAYVNDPDVNRWFFDDDTE